ncbi:hypothetical protein [Flavobacterium sp. HNIBRBA15423]|uniref:hypothetical protein n=1 Tax=Flavobacterium sp. HNIBRBA15423 TaxID=3458683 RepID=UPI0040441E5B
MHLHIDKAYEIIENNLPSNYVDKVMAKIKDETLSSGIIRNIKNRVTKYPNTRINVLNALVEVSKEYQADLNQLKENTKDN